MLSKAPVRIADDFGGGQYGDSRGSRKHVGNDYKMVHGSEGIAKRSGLVTKLGTVYPGTMEFRYVEIQDADKIFCRYLYINPNVKEGDYIHKGDVIGRCQDISTYHVEKNFAKQVENLVKTGDVWGRDKEALKGKDPLTKAKRLHMDNHCHVETFRLVDGKKKYFDSKDY